MLEAVVEIVSQLAQGAGRRAGLKIVQLHRPPGQERFDLEAWGVDLFRSRGQGDLARSLQLLEGRLDQGQSRRNSVTRT